MKVRKPLKLLFYLCLLTITVLVGYKAYLNYFLEDYRALHTEQLDRIQQRVADKEAFRFAVVGNINNSIGIFEKRMVPVLNESGVDFLISAGNAVSGGGADKYRALLGSLSHLDIPYLLTFGPHEYEEFGSFRFYEHFGPHFFSARVGNSRLIFLDSTGKTSWRWQLRWLDDVLARDNSNSRILFVGHPPKPATQDPLFDEQEDYLHPPEFRAALLETIDKHKIDLVFSANLSLYSESPAGNATFITTGGAGGLVLNDDTSFYHYVRVEVDKNGDISHSLQRLPVGQHPILKRLESAWLFLYSLLYSGYLNFLLILAILVAIAIKLYSALFVSKNFYPDYDLDPSAWLNRSLRVAMFTNNYLPFIGGVPISIERLRRGLQEGGDQTLIVAPRYKDQPDPEAGVLRVPALLALGEKREFRIANLFLKRIRKGVRDFRPDIIHLHHPFWLGSLGLFLARSLKVPAIYTYHTRLEHYAHFVPLPGALFRNLISHSLIRRFANKCDGIIVPTHSAEEYLRMIGVKSPTYVQPTGIEYQRFQEDCTEQVSELRQKLQLSDERVLISVSRLSNEKNIDFMIDAMSTLRKQTDRAFRLLIIGEGHQRERLQKKIRDLDLAAQVTLVGAIPPEQMPHWYHLGDAFVFASKSETQGMVILEAMAAGLPVVAVRSSGIDDVVRQGVNGFKTPENQELWIKQVRQLLEDDDLRNTLSEQALAFAKDFSIEQFAADVRHIYASALTQRDKSQEDDSAHAS
ncbi:glycosyltransferase [Marinobacter salinisoli]|uniref:Glycosyltransferase n=1 Tax=Marinobacter salinisoli TaxID=2769486 RepID=A0ABX7MR98_9GAMM|nr:glycosyltransferase [Marinobacter salinisoli]QSP94867.1 glycosyltransferase [Marinobacter salinisoli]